MSNFLNNTTDLQKILNETSDISVLLDNIQRRLEEIFLSAPQLITFTIISTEYQAEEGMTWTEWCESDYNTVGYFINSDYVCFDDGSFGGASHLIYTDYNSVKPTDKIISGEMYEANDDGASPLEI